MVVRSACVHPTSVVGADVTLAEGVTIGPNCFLDGHIRIGAGSHLVGGLTLLGDITIGANCRLEPGICLTGSWNDDGGPGRHSLSIEDGVVIGAGTLITQGLTIGKGARIEAGTFLTRRVPAYAIVHGNPAIISGYVETSNSGKAKSAGAVQPPDQPGISQLSVAGVTLHRFTRIRDLRGDLSVGEFQRNVPFLPKRYFLVFDVPSAETRGEHAHKVCQQFMVCTHGSVAVLVDDGVRREEVVLDSPNLGLYVPPMIWGVQYKYSRDGVLLVFASDYYDPGDYIRDYDAFVASMGAS